MHRRITILFSLVVLAAACSSGITGSTDDALSTGDLTDVRKDLGLPDTVVFSDQKTGDKGNDAFFDVAVDLNTDIPSLSCDPGEGCFMDKCDENGDCQSSWCVEHLGEGVCTQTCQEECPPGWKCKQVGGTDPDVIFICVSDHANLCKPCEGSDNCGSTGGVEDVCVVYGAEGSFCGGKCETDGDCPWGFSCLTTVTVDGIGTLQCVADAGVCPCTDKSIDLSLWTPCEDSNDWGTCGGKRVCMEAGISECDAALPSEEVCNGFDDDCDDETDEPPLAEGEYGNLCDDDNACTEDKCKAEDGCENLPTDGVECLDGDPCTMADHCVQDVCVGTPVECKDDNPCTDDGCDETGGCVFTPNDDACDDGNPCTVGDQCNEEECVGTELPCDCQANEDCGELEDGNVCNGTLVCNMDVLPYKCDVDAQTIIECNPPEEGPDAVCQQAHCVPESGECQVIPANEGFACDDANACTAGDKCVEGTCTPGIEINCADDNPCTDDSCDATDGCVHMPNIAPCSDGDICTVNDTCADGACVPGNDLDCEDSNPCTADSCDVAVGCTHEPADEGCDDGNACTDGDHCEAGVCVVDGPTPCNDGDECTDDSCDPAAGCVFSLNEAPCDDDNLCTLQDHCEQGQCVGGEELLCDDGDPCTDDSCLDGFGCTFVLSEAPCDDGDPCTEQDTCSLGACSGIPKDCDDENPCTDDSCGLDGVCQNLAVQDGTVCGEGPQWQCGEGDCKCVPQCDGISCGDDQCDGSCGECGDGQFCFVGACYYPLALADTGQEKCYANEGELSPCPNVGEEFYGQDGSYAGTPMSFTDNANGTVSDNVTGLVWAKCSAGQEPADCSGFGAALEWQEAVDYCAQNVDGLPGDGWRLPSRLELLSMTDFEKPHCLDKSVFGGEVVAGYWSSTTGGTPTSACGVSFGTCASGCAYQKEDFQTFFRCVRGQPTSSGDFEDVGDGTVRDHATNLQWQKGVSPENLNWSNALDYCEGLDLAGYADWRLPNAKDAASLVDFTPPLWNAAEEFFGTEPKGGFWTATTFNTWSSRGFALGSAGALGDFSNIKTMELLARCVRDFCIADCEGKECGDDGCGGSCGDCEEGICNKNFGVCVESGWVIVPGGSFSMGTSGEESCRNDDEGPLHQVSIGSSLLVSDHEITQAEWAIVTEAPNPSYFGPDGPEPTCTLDTCPVERINWYETVTYANNLSALEGVEQCYKLAGCTGSLGGGCGNNTACVTDYKCDGVDFKGVDCLGYRLPTEAEWEYLARGGTNTAFAYPTPAGGSKNDTCNPCAAEDSLEDYGWYCHNSGDRPHPGGEKPSNAFDLYDMGGNVYEWCWDNYQDDYYAESPGADPLGGSGANRVSRGGSWNINATGCRSGHRNANKPAATNYYYGGRMVRTLPACKPDCEGKECGDNGCGGSCGECPQNTGCWKGECLSVPYHICSTSFGGEGYDLPYSACLDPSDMLYVAGTYPSAVMDVGGFTLTNEGQLGNIFTAKFDKECNAVWAKEFGGKLDDLALLVSSPTVDQVYVTGHFGGGIIDLGGAPVSGNSYVVKLGPQGQHQASSGYSNVAFLAMQKDADGNLLMGGNFSSAGLDFGGGPLSKSGSYDGFVVKLDSQGQHVWSKNLGGTGADAVMSLALAEDGTFYLIGQTDSPNIDLGGGPLNVSGGHDIFVARFDKNGIHEWSSVFGGDQDDTAGTILRYPSGDIVFAGQFNSPAINFGGNDLVNASQPGPGGDICLVRLSEEGTHMWSYSIGGNKTEYMARGLIAGDDSGNLVVAAHYESPTLQIGPFVVNNASANGFYTDILVAKFNAEGTVLSATSYGSAGSEFVKWIAVGGEGTVAIVGDFFQEVDFGGGPLYSLGGDVFVARIGF